MSIDDEAQVRKIVNEALAQQNQTIFNELRPVRELLAQVKLDLYGAPGETHTGIVKVLIRHDTMLWVLVALAALAVVGIFLLLIRG